MNIVSELFGIVVTGEFYPEVFKFESARFIRPFKFSNPIKVDITATECEGKICLEYDEKVIECVDMAEAEIKAFAICVELLALEVKRNLVINLEISALTSP